MELQGAEPWEFYKATRPKFGGVAMDLWALSDWVRVKLKRSEKFY